MSKLDLRAPNDEQLLAIEHSGGVLLSAGAGSGKTFVLVEHIIYLFNEFCKKNEQLEDISFSKEIKSYFAEIVLMTFTKKAAGELFLRMKKRFAQGLVRAENDLEEQPRWKWEEAQLALPYLYIGTIHGFCYRLITQGYIKGFTGDEEMISDLEFQTKIDSLVESWIKKSFDDLGENGYEHFILNKKALKRNFKEVFSDTDIRIMWSNVESRSLTKEEGIEWVAKAVNLLIGQPWEGFSIDANQYRPDSKKVPQWFLFLESAEQATKNNQSAFSLLLNLKNLFESVSRFPSVKKGKVEDEVYDFFQSLKKIREFIKAHFDDIIKFY